MKRPARILAALFPLMMTALGAACGGETQPPATPCPKCPDPGQHATSTNTMPPTPTAATPEEAKKFVDQVDKDLRRLWIARDRAAWVNQNFITDDSEALAANGEEATAAYVTEAIQKTFFEIVAGRRPEYRRWLHPVRKRADIRKAA